MRYIDWNEGKNRLLKKRRNISFEEIVLSIDSSGLLDIVEHHDQYKYPNQKLLIVEVENYAFVVPFLLSDETYFLKTIYPSRKATQAYINKEES